MCAHPPACPPSHPPACLPARWPSWWGASRRCASEPTTTQTSSTYATGARGQGPGGSKVIGFMAPGGAHCCPSDPLQCSAQCGGSFALFLCSTQYAHLAFGLLTSGLCEFCCAPLGRLQILRFRRNCSAWICDMLPCSMLPNNISHGVDAWAASVLMSCQKRSSQCLSFHGMHGMAWHHIAGLQERVHPRCHGGGCGHHPHLQLQ